jgi:hypothetical protein
VVVNGVNDITISEVQSAKSLVIVGSHGGGDPTKEKGLSMVQGGVLVNNTTLRIYAKVGADAVVPSTAWQVIEFF